MVRKIAKQGFKEKMPSFFKVILPGYSTRNLRIPPKFLKHIRNDLSRKATLELNMSSDCSWNVKVSQTKKGVYFKDGWEDFFDDNSVDEGDFLVFTYEGEMQFRIQLFDKSCCERVGFPTIETHKELKASKSTKRPSGAPKEGTSAPDNRGQISAESFKSRFPHFTATVKKTFCLYSMPTAFYRKHLSAGRYQAVFLKTPGGNNWYKVKLVPSNQTAFMSKGWSEFASANRISVGNVCGIELIKENKMVVHILQN